MNSTLTQCDEVRKVLLFRRIPSLYDDNDRGDRARDHQRAGCRAERDVRVILRRHIVKVVDGIDVGIKVVVGKDFDALDDEVVGVVGGVLNLPIFCP